MEVQDADLVLQIGAGRNPDAEAEFCRRMGPRIKLYGLRHLRNDHAADDLAQQVLLTALEALRARRLREPEKLASFVLGTCRRTVIDLRRNSQRREHLLQQFCSELPSYAEPAVAPLDYDRLAACLQNLRERERSVIVMTFFDDLGGAAVAEFLGVSEANVRVIRHRAIHQLRDCIGVAA